jgi:hypothetical protein
MDDETPGTAPDESAGEPPAEEQHAGEAGPEVGAPAGEAEAGPAAGEEGETAVVPPPEEGATQVISGEDAGPTRVMPAAGPPSEPPPPGPAPTLMMSRPPRKKRSNTWWIILVVIVVAAAAAAFWYFVLRSNETSPSPSPSPAIDWSGAWSRTDGGGGGLIIQGGKSTYQVTMYDENLQPLGVSTAKQSDDTLKFTLDTQATVSGLTGPFTITLTPGATPDLAQMKVVSANQESTTISLQRVASLLPASPTPSPTPTTSPTASPSPSESASTTADQQVIDGIDKIQVGVITWATNNNNLYPAAADVTETGAVAQYVSPWPTDPYAGQPMKPGVQPGNYTYEQLNGGSAYKITGYLQNGLTYTLP